MPTPNKPPIKPHRVWLCVFELADAEVARRFPDKPRVRVERTTKQPGPELKAWLNRVRGKDRPKRIRVLYDQMPDENARGGLHNPFEAPRDQAAIEHALKQLRDKLRCAGFTIGNSTTVWHVYAIELKDDHLVDKQPGYRGHVYVGQTSLPVEERVKQHQLGKDYKWKKTAKHSKYCHKHFLRHAPELVPEKLRGAIACSTKALRAELKLRNALEHLGYLVVGGTELLPDNQKEESGGK